LLVFPYFRCYRAGIELTACSRELVAGLHDIVQERRNIMQTTVVLRWLARLWSVASTLFVLAFIVGGAESMRPTAMQALGLLLFPGGVVLGFVIAWRREGVGGLVTVLSLCLFFAWMFIRDGRLRIGGYFVLLAAPGFLFLGAALLQKNRSRIRDRKCTPDFFIQSKRDRAHLRRS
jgi:hypothetical protein